MALQQMRIHGNSVVMQFPGGKHVSPYTHGSQMDGVFDDTGRHIEWSDVVGLHDVDGVTFRGRRDNINFFFASVPTPALREDAAVTSAWGTYLRAKLTRVLIRFSTHEGVWIRRMRVFDGARDLMYPFEGGPRLTGPHSNDWVVNVNYFENPNPPEIFTGVCVVFDVKFDNDGDITFNSVGCDFLLS